MFLRNPKQGIIGERGDGIAQNVDIGGVGGNISGVLIDAVRIGGDIGCVLINSLIIIKNIGTVNGVGYDQHPRPRPHYLQNRAKPALSTVPVVGSV